VLGLARRELRLPRLAVVEGGTTVAASGTSASEIVLLPLPGPAGASLEVGLRPGERVLHDADRRALGLLASPIAVALRAITLNAALAAARSAVVDEREVERQRLQRELHDGVGPQLTGVAFRLDAASNVVGADAEQAARLLGDARADLRRAIATVRAVVHDLRPIELETEGLEDAVRSRVAAIGAGAIEVHVDGQLPPRSAAVDAAVYRITVEAVTNAIRHAPDARCSVRITGSAGRIDVRVESAGAPAAGWRPGVGLASMRHRAEEVGGELTAGPGVDGWVVEASLPSEQAALASA
jgi:two-component system, NarL family, sensor kinase